MHESAVRKDSLVATEVVDRARVGRERLAVLARFECGVATLPLGRCRRRLCLALCRPLLDVLGHSVKGGLHGWHAVSASCSRAQVHVASHWALSKMCAQAQARCLVLDSRRLVAGEELLVGILLKQVPPAPRGDQD